MEYRRFGDCYYLRLDRGEEVMGGILGLCEAEGVASATFSGIGGCSEALLQTFVPERGEFETERLEGMLELVSLMGNVISDDGGQRYLHAHACFATKRDGQAMVAAGHLKATTVLYTAEIELRPVPGRGIGMALNEETGTGFWHFD